ncbi:multidrug transporter [Heyndrickxia shackletonii]|uniref:Multidrug transporter n=1 Tax=Heyndrickxia shackletonii TaxID=157838 RepID=A0A0Q3TBJ2_9BACI|nr:multidrug efflux SMR transporter [Heyndrickxia shackletonii]KQL51462.1 multidrug transporter [Heyndrickxia shackletonii]MBB2480037.1 multidrug efflux SMR transporter [Bacillus sp. APMAM]NEZ00811.1 multidrug efflux SMR transporter [Heyndrickxia shackletonii]RTZ56574.1 multidrug efflux SMR transporter [Bacillus sp. SAJ1]
MNGYITLAISIISEVFATTMLKMSDGFTILLPSIGVIVGYALSFYSISISLKTIPLSLAYAIWSGVGTALTALIGVLIWGELFNTLMLSGIILIIGGVILLNTSNKTETAKETSK